MLQRVILRLVLLILLLNGHHPMIRAPQQPPETMTLTATPIPLDAGDPARRQLDDLRYLDGWSLVASKPSFGGISSMRVADDGAVVALGDGGEIMTFRAGSGQSPAGLRLLPILPTEKWARRSLWDTESMTIDPASGKSWVGFEFSNRICRYSAGFGRVEFCHTPPATRDWPGKNGMESLNRLSDGRFLAIAEASSSGPDGIGHDMLLFAGDPVDPATPPPVRLAYQAPQGYLPTDALGIGHGRLLVLNRRVTLSDGFTAMLTIVDIRTLRSGLVLPGRVVALLMAPVPHDNFEALAMSTEGQQRMLWIASDDNHLFFQRSLLLKFAMPAAWFAGGEGEAIIPPRK